MVSDVSARAAPVKLKDLGCQSVMRGQSLCWTLRR